MELFSKGTIGHSVVSLNIFQWHVGFYKLTDKKKSYYISHMYCEFSQYHCIKD